MKVAVLEGEEPVQASLTAAGAGQFQLFFADVGSGYAAAVVGGQVAGGCTVATTQVKDAGLRRQGHGLGHDGVGVRHGFGMRAVVAVGYAEVEVVAPDGAIDFVGRPVVVGLGVGNDGADVMLGHRSSVSGGSRAA